MVEFIPRRPKLRTLGLAVLLVGGALAASPASAAALTYHWAFTAIGACTSPTEPCGPNNLPGGDESSSGLNQDAALFTSVSGYGEAMALGQLGGAGIPMPNLETATMVTGNASSWAFVLGIQTYANTLDHPVQFALRSTLDLNATSEANAYATAGIAIVNLSDLKPATFALWQASTPDMQFTANCATPGALAVSNALFKGEGERGGAIDTTGATCGGGPLMIDPGQQIAVITRLSTFQWGAGLSTVAMQTDLSPRLSSATRDALRSGLALAVPEPGAWALMIGGFAMAGAALRRRRACASN